MTSVEVPTFAKYYEKRLLPAIRDYVRAPARLREEPATWTNNNAESMNFVLKTQVTMHWSTSNACLLITLKVLLLVTLFQCSNNL